jgi:hypothetical protein
MPSSKTILTCFGMMMGFVFWGCCPWFVLNAERSDDRNKFKMNPERSTGIK